MTAQLLGSCCNFLGQDAVLLDTGIDAVDLKSDEAYILQLFLADSNHFFDHRNHIVNRVYDLFDGAAGFYDLLGAARRRLDTA
ncbi:MAG: hypothetical protein P3W97_010195 [Tepidimonas sp.]|uniref:hypothetical protein n=1 Tax=Tepidimonas sp. TaxID=2002775 RepID=UPI00259E41C2|nr:hypothetical protein [Tepidimonas sp.]MDM7457600.1 hypothetical protein [Tepidimonas sp.]